MNIASITLCVLAILGFLAGGYFTYDNRGRYLQLVEKQAQQEGVLRSTQEKIEEETERGAEESAQKETLDGEIAELKSQAATLESEKSTVEAANAQIEVSVDALAQEIQTAEDQVKSIGDLGQLANQVESKRAALDELGAEHEALTQELANGRARLESFSDRIEHLSDLQRAQQAGEILGGLSTTVRSSFSDEGLVILNGGSNRGVVSGAKFNVLRGGGQIASGTITSVHPGYSVLKLDAGTVTDAVAEGDRAVSVQTAASRPAAPRTVGSGPDQVDETPSLDTTGPAPAEGAATADGTPAAADAAAGPFGGFNADPGAATPAVDATVPDATAPATGGAESGALPGEVPAQDNPFSGEAASPAATEGGVETSSTDPAVDSAAEPNTGADANPFN